MKVIFNYSNNYKEQNPAAIALGTFDGVHAGHCQLIKILLECKKYGYKSIVYTFIDHPLKKIKPDSVPPQIMSLKEKIRNFSILGIDQLVLNNFNSDFMQQSPEEFIQNLATNINLKAVVVGYNFRFGYKGSGDEQLLNKLALLHNFKVVIIDPVYKNGDIVSSSRIRGLISQGKVDEAADLIGKPYILKGRVIHGHKRGKKLGFPTANIIPSKNKVIPKFGVYLTLCRVGKKLVWGVTNVGYNPTFLSSDTVNIETNLIDFNKNIYGETLSISFIKMLREEIKFSNAEELTKQVKDDIKKAKNFIYNFRYK